MNTRLGCLTQANGLVGRCLILMGPLLVLFAGVLVTVLAIVLLALEFAQSELRDARTRAREELVASRRSPMAPSAVDLRPLLIEAVAAVGEDAARPIRLDLPNGYLLVTADPDRVQQVVHNLLSNARKYSPLGGVVQLTVHAGKDMLEVAITDQGLGIPAEALGHLFDPYYRVAGEARRSIRGTGLGLAMVKDSVEAVGGQVGAESAGPGHGSRFWFTLPRAPHVRRVAANEPADSGAAHPRSLRLLAVDHDAAVGSATRRLLRTDGHEVVTARSAEEALDQLRARPFDVVISDLRLSSGRDGWALAAEVRRNWPRVRFVVAMGGAGIDPRAAGIAAVLRKPYQPQELRILLTELGSPVAEQAA